jgi:putative oxidoreductase
MNSLERNQDIGLFILRLTVGLAFGLIFGLPKIEAGPVLWEQIGAATANLGFSFAPTFWGFMASLSEFGGGILLVLGLFVRPAALLMGITMIFATVHHMTAQDQWYNTITPLVYLSIFILLFFTGAGKYSLDAVIFKRKRTEQV